MAKRGEKRERRSVVLEPDAAGIDIGAEEIYVAVPPDRDEESTRRFSSFTGDLHALADWLGRCRIQSVAMESTGVYWIPLFQILEECRFKVYLVNARYLKSVPGRKSDVHPISHVTHRKPGFPPTTETKPERIFASNWQHGAPAVTRNAHHRHSTLVLLSFWRASDNVPTLSLVIGVCGVIPELSWNRRKEGWLRVR